MKFPRLATGDDNLLNVIPGLPLAEPDSFAFTTSNGDTLTLNNITGYFFSLSDTDNQFSNVAFFGAAPAATPEPAQVVASLALAGLGGLSLVVRRLRNRKQASAKGQILSAPGPGLARVFV